MAKFPLLLDDTYKPVLVQQALDEITNRSNPSRSVSRFQDALLTACEAEYMASVYDAILPEIQECVDAYVLINGERPEFGLEADEYDSGLDDAVATVFETYGGREPGSLSASWLGDATVDTRLHLPGEPEKLAQSFAREILKQGEWTADNGVGRSMKLLEKLAAFGFEEDETTAAVAAAPAVSQQPPTENVQVSLNSVVNKIIIGQSFMCDSDDADFSALVENLFDDDATIASSAASMLNIDMTDLEAIQLSAMTGETDAATLLEVLATNDLLDDDAPLAPEDAVAPPAPPSTPAGPKPGVKPGGHAPGSTIPAEVLASLKDPMKDEDFANVVGCSRATFNNYVKGKTAFAPSDDQRKALNDYIMAHVRKLLTALAAINQLPEDVEYFVEENRYK